MIIDDTETDQFITMKVVQAAAFATDITIYSEAEKALAFLRTNSTDAALLPDIIFLDIQMPVLNGFEFLDEFQKLSVAALKKCQIIMVSSSSDSMDTKRAIESTSVKKFIQKPLSIGELRKLSDEFFD